MLQLGHTLRLPQVAVAAEEVPELQPAHVTLLGKLPAGRQGGGEGGREGGVGGGMGRRRRGEGEKGRRESEGGRGVERKRGGRGREGGREGGEGGMGRRRRGEEREGGRGKGMSEYGVYIHTMPSESGVMGVSGSVCNCCSKSHLFYMST